MKRNLLYIIILLIPFLFVNLSFAIPAAPQNPTIQPIKPLPPLFTAKQVKDIIEISTKTVGQNKVITLDEIYADYGLDLGAAIFGVSDYLTPKTKMNIFTDDDHAFFIKGVVIYIMSQTRNEGAVMLGIAFISDDISTVVVNIIIMKGKVHIYDNAEEAFRLPEEYMNVGMKFALVII